jgi:hypothetical protein
MFLVGQAAVGRRTTENTPAEERALGTLQLQLTDIVSLDCQWDLIQPDMVSVSSVFGAWMPALILGASKIHLHY